MIHLILKARTGLVKKNITAHHAGKNYQTTVWVRSGKKQSDVYNPKRGAISIKGFNTKDKVTFGDGLTGKITGFSSDGTKVFINEDNSANTHTKLSSSLGKDIKKKAP